MSKDLSKLKEQYEALGREIKALETFEPGWYLCWNGDIEYRSMYKRIGYLTHPDTSFSHIQRLTPELLAPLFDKPKTRYNWPEIIKKYPSAQWASTDEDGRIDAWKECPKIEEVSGGWVIGKQSGYYVTISPRNSTDWHQVSDWRDSLEKRPDWI